MSLLSVENLSVHYGPIPALRDVSLQIDQGETLAVVGANGAGKSTLTLAVAGAVAPTAGEIGFNGKPIGGRLPEHIAAKGISLVPEGRHIFEGLTVEENLRLGLSVRSARNGEGAGIADMMAMFPILQERRASMATRLSGGEQQQLAIARALLTGPKLLILDEPSLGLAPIMVERVYATLKDLKAQGVTMLLIEQNPARLGDVADRVLVLANGVVRSAGTAGEMLGGSALDEAYLGVRREGAE